MNESAKEREREEKKRIEQQEKKKDLLSLSV
jgi:hypothetical protein